MRIIASTRSSRGRSEPNKNYALHKGENAMARLPVSPSHRSLKSPRSARGFTLHEMLITLLVAGVLS
ncbi:MAG: Tfp pilus assembly protein FimT/FimU, partial [Sulfurifustis sp.]